MSLTTGLADSLTKAKIATKEVKVHDCRKNQNASAEAMEPASALEMLNLTMPRKEKWNMHFIQEMTTPQLRLTFTAIFKELF